MEATVAGGDPGVQPDAGRAGPIASHGELGGLACIAMLVGALALFSWALWVLHQESALRAGVVYLACTTFVYLGAGHLLVRVAGVDENRTTWLGVRYVVGFAACAFAMTLMGSLGLGVSAFWCALALGAAGWGIGAWELPAGRRSRPGRSLIAGEALAAAALLRVAVEGTTYWRQLGDVSQFTQYFDLLYHLALVKVGVVRGLPLRGWVLESGVPRPGYHPAFDSTASLFIKGLGLPVDASLFRLVLPVTLLGMTVALGVLAATWGVSRRAGLLALGFLGVVLAVSALPSGVTAVVGDAGLNNLRYFVYNPPGALAIVAGAAALALVALADGDHPVRPLVLAGVLAGATVMLKANFAIVLIPAFALVLALLAMTHRRLWPAAIAGMGGAALAAIASYPTTLGPVGPPALGVGRLGTHLVLLAGSHTVLHGYSALFTGLAAPLNARGPLGDALLVVLYIVVAPMGIWLLLTLLATWRARAAGEHPFGRRPAVSQMVLAIVGLTVLAALFVNQRGNGYLASWNITWHTVQDLWWLSLCAAAVAVDALVAGLVARRVAARANASDGAGHRRRLLWPAGLAIVAAGLFAASLHGITLVRQVGAARLPDDLRALLQGLSADTPVAARVVQDRDLRTYDWVSALGGRGAVLERSSWTRWVYPGRTAALERDIEVLYETPDAAVALGASRAAGADYAVVDLDRPGARGLRRIGVVTARKGDWVLLRLPGG